MPLKIDHNWRKGFEEQSCALAWKLLFSGVDVLCKLNHFITAFTRKQKVIAVLNSNFPL